jgi:four helix bundle protein
MQDYRRLRVWRKAHALALNIRRATHRFPRSGYAKLKAQVTGAAESVPSNIVEGCGSHSQKDLARFLDTSIKSTSELEYQLLLARDYGVLAPDHWNALTEETIDVRRMLCGLRARVLKSELSQPEHNRKTDTGKTVNS